MMSYHPVEYKTNMYSHVYCKNGNLVTTPNNRLNCTCVQHSIIIDKYNKLKIRY